MLFELKFLESMSHVLSREGAVKQGTITHQQRQLPEGFQVRPGISLQDCYGEIEALPNCNQLREALYIS